MLDKHREDADKWNGAVDWWKWRGAW